MRFDITMEQKSVDPNNSANTVASVLMVKYIFNFSVSEKLETAK